MFSVMVGGMAIVAGSVMVAPPGLVISKIMIPEIGTPKTKNVVNLKHQKLLIT